MKTDFMINCTNKNEVNAAVQNLDIAIKCDLTIDLAGVPKKINDYKGVYNVSKDRFCGVVTSRYNLVQHKDYVLDFADAMNRLNLDYSINMMTFKNKIFADIKFNDKNIKLDKLNEEFITGVRLINSYDKTTCLSIQPMFTRLACTNGMIMTSFSDTLSIRHDSTSVKRIAQEIELKLSRMINNNSYLEKWVSESMGDSIEWNVCCGIIEKLFAQIKHREGILNQLGISVIKVKEKSKGINKVRYVLDEKLNNTITRWKLYNAVTSYLTHNEHITPHINDMLHKQAEKILTKSSTMLPQIEVEI